MGQIHSGLHNTGPKGKRRFRLKAVPFKFWMVACGVAIVLVSVIGWSVYRYQQNRQGIINAATYPWPVTEKGSVKDQTKKMTDSQKAEYFFMLAFEYKNTNKLDDADASIKVSLQYQRSQKALLLAASLAETRGDYDKAVQYYRDVISLLNQQKDPLLKLQAEQYEKRIENLKKAPSQPKTPATPVPNQNPSEVGA